MHKQQVMKQTTSFLIEYKYSLCLNKMLLNQIKSKPVPNDSKDRTLLNKYNLLFMEPWVAAKKSFKVVWRYHELLSGFLVNDHLPRVSR